MTAAEFIGRLHGARPSGPGKWIASCPAHNDLNPSLSVAAADGKVLVRCMAGCDAGAVCDALGLTLADLFERDGAPPSVKPRKTLAKYDYVDEAGALLYQTVRYDPKDFRQRRPDGAGGWIWKLDDTRRVLYRLPTLQGVKRVVIVEGEKDVHTADAWQMPATCNAMGASKWRSDSTEQLVAAGVQRVIIVPDNDAPGLAHADRVARACAAAGTRVQVVMLDIGKDLTEYVAAGKTKADFLGLIEATADFDLTAVSPLAWTGAGAAKNPGPDPNAFAGPAPVVVRLDSVQPETVDWLWYSRLARGKLTILAGEPGLGKSFVTMDIAARISRGLPWPDGSGSAPNGNVLLLTAEDGLADTVRPRLDRLSGDPSRVSVLAAVRDGGNERSFSLDKDIARLQDALDSTGASLCVIDPITAYLGKSDSYKDADVRSLLAPLTRLAEERGVAVVVVMHLRKAQGGTALQRLSGSIGFGAAARVVLAVGKDEDDPDRRLFAGVKSNLGKLAPTLAFRIDGDEDAGVLKWEPGEVEGIDGERLLTAGTIDRSESDSAQEFFDTTLPPGASLAQSVVMEKAKAWGISVSTVYRWKRRLGIPTQKNGFAGGWVWTRSLRDAPTDQPKVTTKVPTTEEMSTFVSGPMESGENAGITSKVVTPNDGEYLRGGRGASGKPTTPAAVPTLPSATNTPRRY